MHQFFVPQQGCLNLGFVEHVLFDISQEGKLFSQLMAHRDLTAAPQATPMDLAAAHVVCAGCYTTRRPTSPRILASHNRTGLVS